MNAGLVLATMGIIIPAELPDKTFIASVVLSSRHRPLPVWIGAATGLILQALIGVVAGRLLALAPHRVVQIIVAVAFLGGAAYLLLGKEKTAEGEGAAIAEREEGELDGETIAVTAGPSSVRIALTTFAVVTAAEFGDLTQVVVANLTARTKDPVSVFVGAAIGFILISGGAVLAGRTITRFIPLTLVRKISGVIILGLGIWSALQAAGV
jgi:Ca2+/H+ antiporter, TMEM165/GDT1 family